MAARGLEMGHNGVVLRSTTPMRLPPLSRAEAADGDLVVSGMAMRRIRKLVSLVAGVALEQVRQCRGVKGKKIWEAELGDSNIQT